MEDKELEKDFISLLNDHLDDAYKWAIKKQVRKKPLWAGWEHDFCICPDCKYPLFLDDKMGGELRCEYCCHCGQHIDWSDSNVQNV